MSLTRGQASSCDPSIFFSGHPSFEISNVSPKSSAILHWLFNEHHIGPCNNKVTDLFQNLTFSHSSPPRTQQSLRGTLFGQQNPVFLRTRPQPYDVASAVLALLKHFNWLKVAYLTTEDPELGFTVEVLRNTLISHRIQIQYTTSFRFPQLCGLSKNDFHEIVEKSFRFVRIYLVVGEVYDSICFLEALRKAGLLKGGKYDHCEGLWTDNFPLFKHVQSVDTSSVLDSVGYILHYIRRLFKL